MFGFLIVLIVIISILLMLAVLVQSSKGGGLSSSFGGAAASSQFLGVKRTTDVLEKATWVLAGALLVFCLFINFLLPEKQKSESKLKEPMENQNIPTPTIPTLPSNQPK